MHYYRVKEGKELRDHRNNLIGSAGEIVELATDSKDKIERREAEGLLLGQHSCVVLVSASTEPDPNPKKKVSKKASYQTKDALSDD